MIIHSEKTSETPLRSESLPKLLLKAETPESFKKRELWDYEKGIKEMRLTRKTSCRFSEEKELFPRSRSGGIMLYLLGWKT